MAIQQRGTAMFACLGFLSLVLTAFPPAKALAKGGAEGAGNGDAGNGTGIQLELVWGYHPFDRNCENWTDDPIPKPAYAELAQRVTALDAQWQRDASLAFGALASIVGEAPRLAPQQAFLTLCRVQSMSRPLIINIRPFLDTTRRGPAWPQSRFTALLLHELLHQWVQKLALDSTPALDALASESVVVHNHLHVFALMKAIYRQLGQEDTFADIVAMDAQAKDPAYARAWALLESPGTEQTLVNEVRAAATRISGQSAATD